MAHASPAMTDWTGTTDSPRFDEKTGFLTSTAVSPAVGLDSTDTEYRSAHHHSPGTTRILTHVKRLKRYNNIFGYVLSLVSVGITLVMEGIMIYVLYKFYTTKDIPAPGRKSPWAKGTTLWPTFVLLVGSIVTFVLDLGSMIAACCRNSKRALNLEERLGFIALVCYVVKWIVIAALYMAGKTSKDLWGWSCDIRAEKIQQYYVSHLNFKQMCLEQTIASYLSWIEGGLKVILFLTTLTLTYKLKKAVRQGS